MFPFNYFYCFNMFLFLSSNSVSGNLTEPSPKPNKEQAYLTGIGLKNEKKALLLDIEKVIMDEDINVISEEVKQWKQHK